MISDSKIEKIKSLLTEMEGLLHRGLALAVFYFACVVLLSYSLFVRNDKVSLAATILLFVTLGITRIYEKRRDRRFREIDAELTKIFKER